MPKNYVKRGSWFYYFRRVPKQLAPFDRRKHVRIALRTKSEKEAVRLAGIYDDFVEKYWAELIRSGDSDTDKGRFERARAIAQAHGFAYKNMADILEGPLDDILSRIEAVGDDPAGKAPALLGAVKEPSLRLVDCEEEFWALCADRFAGKSEHQVRKYKNPRRLALLNFVSVVGNLEVKRVSRNHILQFRRVLMGRINGGTLVGNTANKQLTHLKDILITIGNAFELRNDFKSYFIDTFFRQESRVRPPFEAEFVQRRLIDAAPFGGLNFEARLLVYLMMDTGARETEIIGLNPREDIFLREDVPHLWIRQNEIYGLKTPTSERKIPLVGISLWAARQIPRRGFARYHKNPDSVSGVVNKFLREHNLKPTPKHTLYGLRHTFKDRLRDVGAPEEVIDELMGHKKHGPQYGRGHTLATKRQWLERIAFKVPDGW